MARTPPVERCKVTPAQPAHQWGVHRTTTMFGIRSGAIKAIDLSKRPGMGLPRHRIDRADLAEFEVGRAGPKPDPPRRRRPTMVDVTQYVESAARDKVAPD